MITFYLEHSTSLRLQQRLAADFGAAIESVALCSIPSTLTPDLNSGLTGSQKLLGFMQNNDLPVSLAILLSTRFSLFAVRSIACNEFNA